MKLANFLPIASGGALIATFDIEFTTHNIIGMGLYRSRTGGMFVSEPTKKYTRKHDGNVFHLKTVVITNQNTRQEIATLAKLALAEIETDKLLKEIPF